MDVGNSKDTFSLVINFVKPSVLTRKKISDPEQHPNSDQPTRSSPSDVGNQILESSLGDDLVKPSVIRSTENSFPILNSIQSVLPARPSDALPVPKKDLQVLTAEP